MSQGPEIGCFVKESSIPLINGTGPPSKTGVSQPPCGGGPCDTGAVYNTGPKVGAYVPLILSPDVVERMLGKRMVEIYYFYNFPYQELMVTVRLLIIMKFRSMNML